MAIAQLTDDIASADVTLAVDSRTFTLFEGKVLKVQLALAKSEQTVVLDGSKGFVQHYRVQAKRIMALAADWITENRGAIEKLRGQ